MTTQVEVERKFAIAPGAALPPLSDIAGVAAVGPETIRDLQATYYDTADLRLARSGLTLRRRTGGADAGWHLKVPTAGGRIEYRMALGDGDEPVPGELADRCRAFVRSRTLAPVLIMRTRRVERPLLDGAGGVLASVADDAVVAQRLLGDGASESWRELEVELVDGSIALLDAATEVFAAAGITPAEWASKLQRGLGPLAVAANRAGTADVAGPDRADRREGSAGEAVLAYLRSQVDALLTQDPRVRHDEPDAVHQMRVATRRLRSILATARPLLQPERPEHIRSELKWLGGVLGAARDAEVLRDRLDALVAEQPPTLVLGPVRARIRIELQARHHTAVQEVGRVLDEGRYFDLLDDLDDLLDDPPWRDAAEEPATDVLPRLVRKAAGRVDRTARVAGSVPDGHPQQAEWLHEVRKSAKRARYAAEAAQPTVGKPAKRLARRMEALQEALGEQQDAVAAQQMLRELGVTAHLSGENGFTFGLLHAIERERAAAAVAGYAELLAAASTRRVRRWTRR